MLVKIQTLSTLGNLEGLCGSPNSVHLPVSQRKQSPHFSDDISSERAYSLGKEEEESWRGKYRDEKIKQEIF